MGNNGHIRQTADTILKHYNIDRATAIIITAKIWDAAMKEILSSVGNNPRAWERLPIADKAFVCAKIIRALVNKKNLIKFMAGEKRNLC